MTKIKNFFKSITNSKKKIFALALSVCVVVLSIAGSSIAYFTDTEKFTNTFTAGNVEITLSEAQVKNDGVGNLVEDDSKDRIVANEAPQTQAYGAVFPGQSIYKDPKITNTGSENAYIGAVITITNDNGVDDTADITDILVASKLTSFITGINPNATVKYTVDTTNGVYKIYMVFATPLAKDGEYTLFTGVQIDKDWSNTDMEDCNGLNIVVDAYATQQSGFADAITALTKSFNTGDWAKYNTASDIPTT